MTSPRLRRSAIATVFATGVGLLVSSFVGMSGVDARLATIAKQRQTIESFELVNRQEAEPRGDCPKIDHSAPASNPEI